MTLRLGKVFIITRLNLAPAPEAINPKRDKDWGGQVCTALNGKPHWESPKLPASPSHLPFPRIWDKNWEVGCLSLPLPAAGNRGLGGGVLHPAFGRNAAFVSLPPPAFYHPQARLRPMPHAMPHPLCPIPNQLRFSQISLANSFVRLQLTSSPFHHNLTRLQHIAAIGHLQSHVSVLLY